VEVGRCRHLSDGGPEGTLGRKDRRRCGGGRAWPCYVALEKGEGRRRKESIKGAVALKLCCGVSGCAGRAVHHRGSVRHWAALPVLQSCVKRDKGRAKWGVLLELEAQCNGAGLGAGRHGHGGVVMVKLG